MIWNDFFETNTNDVSDNLKITIFESKDLTPEIINFFDSNLISVCEGINSTSSVEEVKLRLLELFRGKEKNFNWQMGAIAEFMIHMYVNMTGFKQECMFFNLEERSIKKGFDGFYSLEGEQWIMESKSGNISTENISHKKKTKEALIDLNDKFAGNSSNNAWTNAYNHASHCDVGTPSEIRKSIKNLSRDYLNKVFYKIDNFNIMPCATIFLNDIWINQDVDTIMTEIENEMESYQYKSAHVICTTHKTINIFKHYIGL